MLVHDPAKFNDLLPSVAWNKLAPRAFQVPKVLHALTWADDNLAPHHRPGHRRSLVQFPGSYTLTVQEYLAFVNRVQALCKTNIMSKAQMVTLDGEDLLYLNLIVIAEARAQLLANRGRSLEESKSDSDSRLYYAYLCAGTGVVFPSVNEFPAIVPEHGLGSDCGEYNEQQQLAKWHREWRHAKYERARDAAARNAEKEGLRERTDKTTDVAAQFSAKKGGRQRYVAGSSGSNASSSPKEQPWETTLGAGMATWSWISKQLGK